MTTAERLLLIREHDPSCTLEDLAELSRKLASIVTFDRGDECHAFDDDSTLCFYWTTGGVST
jgi:hypothetical protein